MKSRPRMAAAKSRPAEPAPFLVVGANNRDANEWTEYRLEDLASIYPLTSKSEAVAMMNEVIAGGSIVARIFRYDPQKGAYSIDDEWSGREVAGWQRD